MDSLEEYREQQIAALRRQGEQNLQQVRAQLRERMEVFCNEKIAKLQETIRKNNEDAIASFNQGSAALEEKRRQGGKWHSYLLEAEERYLKLMLDSTLEGNRNILDASIGAIKRQLQAYRRSLD